MCITSIVDMLVCFKKRTTASIDKMLILWISLWIMQLKTRYFSIKQTDRPKRDGLDSYHFRPMGLYAHDRA